MIGVIPTVQDQDGGMSARRLAIDELLSLLATDDAPPMNIAVVLLEDEKLYKHFARIGTVVGKISWPGYKDIVLFANWKE